MPPDQRKLNEHIEGGPFQLGVAEERWDHVAHKDDSWPHAVFWIAAAPREGAPSRYYLRLDCAGYPTSAPTGTFWDPEKKTELEHPKRPAGDSFVGMVFRVNWEGGKALYYPYDRVAIASHGQWPKQHPQWIWDEHHTIVDVLSLLHQFLTSNDYKGERGG